MARYWTTCSRGCWKERLPCNTSDYFVAWCFICSCKLFGRPVLFPSRSACAAWKGGKPVSYTHLQWVAPEHCLLLVGYDDYFYYFNDPRDSKARTYYRKEAVDRAYKAQGSQAVVIQADARTAREWKVRQVLSAFEMVKDKLPSGSIEFEKTIRLLTSDTVDVELIAVSYTHLTKHRCHFIFV